jgi:hypothetical protein
MPGSTYTIRKYIVGEDLVRSTLFATITTLRATTGNDIQLVHMARHYFPFTGIEPSPREKRAAV